MPIIKAAIIKSIFLFDHCIAAMAVLKMGYTMFLSV